MAGNWRELPVLLKVPTHGRFPGLSCVPCALCPGVDLSHRNVNVAIDLGDRQGRENNHDDHVQSIGGGSGR